MQRAQTPPSVRARNDGLRRVRKLTWRIGLVATGATLVVGARFAHLTSSLSHLTSGLTGQSSSQSSSSPQSGSSSQGTPSGIQPAAGSGQAVSGGS